MHAEIASGTVMRVVTYSFNKYIQTNVHAQMIPK